MQDAMHKILGSIPYIMGIHLLGFSKYVLVCTKYIPSTDQVHTGTCESLGIASTNKYVPSWHSAAMACTHV